MAERVLGKQMSRKEFEDLLNRDLGREAFDGLKGFWDEMSEYVMGEGEDDELPPALQDVLQPPDGCQDCDARETIHWLYPRLRLLAVAELGAIVEQEPMHRLDREVLRGFLRQVAQSWSSQIGPSSAEPQQQPAVQSHDESWSSAGSAPVADRPASSPTGSEGPTGL